ncbi:hypothetical protein MASR2M15_27150 [Anaerolineales bacterium]
MSTPENRPFSWYDAIGFLVLAGSNTSDSPIRAQVITRAATDGGIAYISLAEDGGDAFLEDMDDLGAPPGFMIDLYEDDPETIEDGLSEAGIVVIQAGERIDTLYAALRGKAIGLLRSALERGAFIFVEGDAIQIFGTWFVSDEGQLRDGFDWVHNSLIIPDSQNPEMIQALLMNIPKAIGLTIGQASALVLTYDQTMELWGNRDVKISFGSQFDTED